jgi:hypothetical protein
MALAKRSGFSQLLSSITLSLSLSLLISSLLGLSSLAQAHDEGAVLAAT